MNTKPLEKFAQAARRQLHEQVAAKLARVLQSEPIPADHEHRGMIPPATSRRPLKRAELNPTPDQPDSPGAVT